MITPQSTPAEVIAHYREAIAYWEADLANETDARERVRIQRHIDKHRERLARAEKETA